MNVTPRILVLTLSFGSGHVRAAEAIAKELKQQAPGAEAPVVDALEGCRWWFRAIYAAPYWIMVRHFPWAWRWLFKTRIEKVRGRTAPEWLFRFGCDRLFEQISSAQPEAIVAVEVAACEMAAMARCNGLTDARIISVITDHEAEPAWVKREVDAYAVPDEAVSEQFIGWGAPRNKIHVTGIAVDDSFRVNPKAGTRQGPEHDLEPIVLLMGGGMGPTSMDRVAGMLCASGTPMRIVAVTGHDKRVRQKLKLLHAAPPISLEVVGWTDDVAALMHSATLLITKPGGVTIAEASLCGLPAVLFDPIPGPEQTNAARLANAGAAMVTNGVEETVAAAISLLNDDRARRAMSAKGRELASPDAATSIARIILNRESSREVARTKTA